MAGVGGDVASTSTGWAPPGTAPGFVPPSGAHPPGGTFSSDASVTVTGVHTYLGAHSHLVTLVCYSPCGSGGFVYTFGVGEGERALRVLCVTLNTYTRDPIRQECAEAFTIRNDKAGDSPRPRSPLGSC